VAATVVPVPAVTVETVVVVVGGNRVVGVPNIVQLQ